MIRKHLFLLCTVLTLALGVFSEKAHAQIEANFTLFLLKDGRVMSAGNNAYGELGRTTTGTLDSIPGLVDSLTDVVAVAEGGDFSLALKKDGTVWSWGRNDVGQLGDNSGTAGHTVPRQIPNLSCVVQIDAGAKYALALLADGTVMGWGDNFSQQLGYTGTGSTVPILVSGSSMIKKIVASGSSSFLLLSNGTMWASGLNHYGVLGNGSSFPTSLASTTAAISNIKDVASDGLATIVLLNNGTVRTWGNVTGNSTSPSSLTPVIPDGIGNNVISIAPNLVRLSNDSIKIWNTSCYSFSTPQPGPVYNNIAEIKKSHHFIVFTFADGTIKVIGDNVRGQLGDGSTVTSCTPVSPIGVSNVRANSIPYVGTVAYAGEDLKICGGLDIFSIQLGRDTGCFYDENITYSWSPTTYLNNPNIPNPIASGTNLTSSITYTLTQTAGGVTTTDQVTLEVIPSIVLTEKVPPVTPTQTVCAGTPTALLSRYDISGGLGAGSYTYLWSPATNLNDPTLANPTFTSSTIGTTEYSVTVFSGGCSRSYSYWVKVIPQAPGSVNFTEGCNLFSVVNPIQATYNWAIDGSPAGTGTSISPSLTGGMYNIMLYMSSVCGTAPSTTRAVNVPPSYTNYNASCCASTSSNYTSGYRSDFVVDAEVATGLSKTLTWSGATANKSIFGTVYIEDGYTLSISSATIRFGMDGRIVIKRGGKLIVSNAILAGFENGACKTMWQGIEVWGDSSFSQVGPDSLKQGRLFISGTSQINDAHKAIFVGQRNFCYPPVGQNCSNNSDYISGYGGGMIRVQSCTFNRNGVDIQFAPYIDPETSSNIAIIKGNIFRGGKLLDPAYNTLNTVGAPAYPNVHNRYYAASNSLGRTVKHIQLYKVFGLDIQDNVLDSAEYGIDAVDAKFNVTRASAGNDFKYLKYGIVMSNTASSSSYPHIIKRNKFNKISKVAIMITGGRLETIDSNEFGLPNLTSTQADNPVGIYFSSTGSFSIIDNSFYRLDTAIHIVGSGGFGGKIESAERGNYFTRCKIGVMTSGSNGNLQIRCNFFDNTGATAGEYIRKNWDISGTLAHQGGNADHTKPAGNEFFPDTAKHINSGAVFTYYRHAQSVSATQSVTPTIVGGLVTVSNTGLNKQSTSCVPGCTPSCDLVSQVLLDDRQTTIGTFLSNGDDAAAARELSRVSVNAENKDWVNLTRMAISLQQQSKTWFDMDKEQEATIREIAAARYTQAAANASAILHLVYGEEIPMLAQREENAAQGNVQKPSIAENHLMEVYPNPADATVNIAYSIEQGGVLEISDLMGRTVQRIKAEEGNNLWTGDISQHAAGTYFISLKDQQGRVLSVKKLVIQ